MKEQDRMELVLEVSCSMICCQLEICCWVFVCSEGIQVLRVVKRSRYVQRYTSTRGENTFSIQSRAAVTELERSWLCCPSQAGSLLRQVKLESRALLSAVCQLAVNIYCFSCCKASSQHVREKYFNVLKAQSTQQLIFFLGELRFLAGARTLLSRFLKAVYKLCQFAVIYF